MFSREVYIRFVWVGVILAVLFTLMNAFVLGGDAFVIAVSDLLPIPLSIMTTLNSFVMWRKFVPRSSGTTMWGWLVIGWGMWAIGETLYFILSLTSGELPYPSVADYFYIGGYFPFAFGLISRLRETPRKIAKIRKIHLFVAYAMLITAAFAFVILPVLQNSDPATVFLTVLDISYAIGDILVLFLAIRLLVDYQIRTYGNGWMLLIIGFILMTFADLMYSYTISFDLYNPGDKANLITGLGNSVPYVLAYIFFIFGIYRLQIRQDYDIPMPELTKPTPVENAHILFFLNKNFMVDSVSFNFARVFTEYQPVGSEFFSLLGIKKTLKQEIINQLSSTGRFADLELLVKTRKNEHLLVKASGVSTTDPRRNFDGIVIVLRLLANSNDMDSNLTDYQVSIARHVRIKSGSSEETAICDFLRVYYFPLFKQLEVMVHKFGGAQQGVVFMEYLNQTAERKGWDIRIGAKELTSGNFNEPFRLLKDTSALMSVGREYLGRIADVNEIDMELERVKAQFGVPVNQNYRYIKAVYRQHTGELSLS